MKLRLVCVGKLSEAWQQQAVTDYCERLKRYLSFELIELKEEKGGGKSDIAGLLKREGARILDKVPEQAYVIVLDERGGQLTSEGLSEQLEDEMLHSGRDWCLVIGGPYGLDSGIHKRADQLLALSKMTFTHQMARVFLLEQLYRACTIIRNEPYHNR